jgi:hypothetical protein
MKKVITQGNAGGISQLNSAAGPVADKTAAPSPSYRISWRGKQESTRRNTDA